MSNPIVGLEGGVCAGKSTLRRGLEAQGCSGLKEYMDYIDSSLHTQISDWTLSFKTRFFLEIEKARKSDLSSTQKYIDRTYLTLLAHDYARDDKRRLQSGYRSLYMRYSEHLIQPTKIVYLSVSHKIRSERAIKRGIPMSGYFTESRFNDRNREFFERIAAFFPVLILETDKMSPEEVLQKTQLFECDPDRRYEGANLLGCALKVATGDSR